MAHFDTEVAIVGAGPVGLCLALLLAERGVAVLLLEADAEPAEDLRASTFHPPTLDLLEPYGITAGMLEQGLICPHWQIRLHPSGDRAVFDLSVLAEDTRHPYRLQCEQWRLSRLLRARLGGTVEYLPATRLDSFEQDEHGVSGQLIDAKRHPGRRLRISYDGYRGSVSSRCRH